MKKSIIILTTLAIITLGGIYMKHQYAQWAVLMQRGI